MEPAVAELEDYENPPGYGDTIGFAQVWQPMETAPKRRGEMRTFLLIGRYPGDRGWSDIYAGWWDDHERKWMRWPHAFPPTHWMPAPSPPAT
jgi:hypothetical protein